ncbi:MAG: DUF4012 domain-containing protein [Patescibacteria group bacterium]
MAQESPNFLTCPVEPWPGDLPSKKTVPPMAPKEPKEPKDEKEPEFKPTWRFKKRWIGYALLFIVVLALLPAIIGGVRAGIAGLAAKNALTRAQQDIKTLNVDAAKADVEKARASLQEMRAALQAMGFWRDLPGVGTQIRGVEDAAGAGSGTLDSVSDLLDVATTIVDALRGGAEAETSIGVGIAPTRSFNDLSKEEKRDLLQKFSNSLPQLRLARDKMGIALEYWNRVPQTELASPIRKAIQPLADALPVLKRSLDEALPLIETIVPMSGYPQSRRYLMTLQNATELRPGGGFIGTVGTMTMDAGDLSEFSFTDVYNIDNPVSGVWKETPPEPIKTYLGIDNWFLRDANWSPDFSVSAERILDFYIRESELQLHAQLPQRPDTYLAFEPGFFEGLLRITGPITTDGLTFDADNFLEKIEYEVEIDWLQKGLAVDERKAILSRIGDQMRVKVLALPASRWPEVLDLVTKALAQKQIMAYSRDASLQSIFQARGWSAQAKPTNGDFLWTVDANLAALKTDGVMKKAVTYSLNMNDPRGSVATVKLTYTNTAKGLADYRYTRYRTYTRVYVPEGAQLLSSSGAMKNDIHITGGRVVPGVVDVMKELGKTVYGAFWSIEPNHTGELTFTYLLPQAVADQVATGAYHLDWLKQAGVDDEELTLDLSLGKNITSAVPAEDESKWGDARFEYETDSLTDRSFDIQLR